MHRIILVCRSCRRDQPFFAPTIPALSRAIRRAGWLEAIGPDADWSVGGYCPEDRDYAGERRAA